MNTHEDLIESVLKTTQKYNCGTTISTLLPSILFLFYFWRLSETYIIAYMNPVQRPRRLHRIPKDLWWKLWLKVTLTSMLVWSGSQCWSDGLIPLLKKHTLVLLTIINNTIIKPYYEINQTTLLSLESICKQAVCYSVVAFIRWSYIYVDNNYQYIRRRSRTRRIYNWRTLIPGRGTGELGEDGYLLMQPVIPTEPQHRSELVKNNPKKLKLTESCQLSTRIKSNFPKVTVRRKSI